mgnify:CR=1 FL=1
MGICRRKLPEAGRGPSDSLQGLNGLCTATSTYQDGIPISLPGIKVFFRRLASQLYIFYFIRAIYRRRRSRSRKWDFTCLRTPPNKINHTRTGANKPDTWIGTNRDKQVESASERYNFQVLHNNLVGGYSCKTATGWVFPMCLYVWVLCGGLLLAVECGKFDPWRWKFILKNDIIT